MARMRLISMIDEEISKVEADLTKAQEKCEALSARLLELQRLKQDCEDKEAKQVMEAFHRSGKSLRELMTFLDV